MRGCSAAARWPCSARRCRGRSPRPRRIAPPGSGGWPGRSGGRGPRDRREDPLDPAAELLEVPGFAGRRVVQDRQRQAGDLGGRQRVPGAIRGPRTPRRRAPDGPGNRPVRGPRWAVGRTDDPGRGGRIARPPPGAQLLGEAGDRLQPPVVPGGEPLEGRRGLRVPPAGVEDPGLDLHERRRLRGQGLQPAEGGRGLVRPIVADQGAEIIGQGLRVVVAPGQALLVESPGVGPIAVDLVESGQEPEVFRPREPAFDQPVEDRGGLQPPGPARQERQDLRPARRSSGDVELSSGRPTAPGRSDGSRISRARRARRCPPFPPRSVARRRRAQVASAGPPSASMTRFRRGSASAGRPIRR